MAPLNIKIRSDGRYVACVAILAHIIGNGLLLSSVFSHKVFPICFKLLVGQKNGSSEIHGDNMQYAGWPKKVSHYQESSLNRVKNRQ